MDETPSMCSDCAKNRHLRNLIARDGTELLCSLCRQQRPKVFDLDRLADILSDVIQENFAPVGWEPGGRGDSLETIVGELLIQDVEFLDILVETLVERDDHDLRDGGEAFFDGGGEYCAVRHRVKVDLLFDHWHSITAELKHKRRFFSASAHALFDGLFSDIETYSTWNVNLRTREPVIRTLAPGMLVYRARAIEPGQAGEILAAPYREVGPPPRAKARSMRMSPEGVVALYVAMKPTTAIAELRPAIGGTVAVVELALARPLQVLDFERLERAFDAGWSELLHPDPQSARETRQFLCTLHRLIAAPVVPGHEDDYLITQSMAEYLSHVHPLKLDGILFKSVQDQGGTNLVVFPGWDGSADEDLFPVDYVDGSVAFHRVHRVAYAADRLTVHQDWDDEVCLLTKDQMEDLKEDSREQERENDG
ncbi:RES domain-containing protein [Rugamonas aquatica]|uniref:RES domain-containing protein n=1 Tax=Rugamonas aquatica TaxID=2743357 RepID=A0A6A7N716_9BURK|nr:RES domain-containing protein [Rugamonas aquatica]MQA40668.1 RES domain-containing protein [Rugamonas aquatica]